MRHTSMRASASEDDRLSPRCATGRGRALYAVEDRSVHRIATPSHTSHTLRRVPRRLASLSLLVTFAALTALAAACSGAPAPDPRRDAALSDTLTGLIVRAYDFSKPGVTDRLMALYPTEGPIVSAA